MAISPNSSFNFYGASPAAFDPAKLSSYEKAALNLPAGSGLADSASLSSFAMYALPPNDQEKMLDYYKQLWDLQQQLYDQMAAGDEEGAAQTQAQIDELFGGLDESVQNRLAPPPVPEFQHGGGGFTSTFTEPSENARQASPEDFQGGTPLGREIAAAAFSHATDGTGDGRHCFRNVSQVLSRFGIETHGESAYMAADQLAKNSKVQEVTGLDNDDLKKLPPGAIVVWDRGNGHEHGHISVAMGNGREASDVMRNQITSYGTKFRVFLPKDSAKSVGGASHAGSAAHRATPHSAVSSQSHDSGAHRASVSTAVRNTGRNAH